MKVYGRNSFAQGLGLIEVRYRSFFDWCHQWLLLMHLLVRIRTTDWNVAQATDSMAQYNDDVK